VEFVIYPTDRFLDPELRKSIYEEHEDLLVRLAYSFISDNPSASKESARGYAFEEASRAVGIKYGVSKEDLLSIIVEGSDKWTQFRLAFKTDQNNA